MVRFRHFSWSSQFPGLDFICAFLGILWRRFFSLFRPTIYESATIGGCLNIGLTEWSEGEEKGSHNIFSIHVYVYRWGAGQSRTLCTFGSDPVDQLYVSYLCFYGNSQLLLSLVLITVLRLSFPANIYFYAPPILLTWRHSEKSL